MERAPDRSAPAGSGGGDAGLDAFYDVTARPLLAQLYAMCGDMDEARGCLERGYRRARRAWPSLCTREDPAAWVRRAACDAARRPSRRARNAVRRWGDRRRAGADRHGGSGGDADRGGPEDGEAFVAALCRLPFTQREAIVLHHLAGLAVDEIAAQLHVPPGRVRARLARGRYRLAVARSGTGPAVQGREDLGRMLRRAAGPADGAPLPAVAAARAGRRRPRQARQARRAQRRQRR